MVKACSARYRHPGAGTPSIAASVHHVHRFIRRDMIVSFPSTLFGGTTRVHSGRT